MTNTFAFILVSQPVDHIIECSRILFYNEQNRNIYRFKIKTLCRPIRILFIKITFDCGEA